MKIVKLNILKKYIFLFQYLFFCPNEMFKWVTTMSLWGLKQLDLAPYWSLQGSRQVSTGRLSKHHKIYRCIYQTKNFTQEKQTQLLLKISFLYIFSIQNCPATRLPPYIIQTYLVFSKINPINFKLSTKLIIRC